MLDTPCSEVVRRVLATHPIRHFTLHFPSRASPCAITFQLDSTWFTVSLSEDVVGPWLKVMVLRWPYKKTVIETKVVFFCVTNLMIFVDEYNLYASSPCNIQQTATTLFLSGPTICVTAVNILRECGLQPRCKWDLHFSGILGSAGGKILTDVAGQPIDPIFKDLGEDGADRLYRITNLLCVRSQKSAYLSCKC